MLLLLQLVFSSHGPLLCLLIIEMSSRALMQNVVSNIEPDEPDPFEYCEGDFADNGEFRANVSCESTDQITVMFTVKENLNHNYYAVIHCFNETHHSVSELDNELRGTSPQFTSNVSALFSSENLTCTAVGCYEDSRGKKIYKLQANNCSLTPNPTSNYRSTTTSQDSNSISTSAVSHFSINATTSLQISTALSSITISASSSSHDHINSADHMTTSYQSLTIPTSTLVAVPNSTTPSTGHSKNTVLVHDSVITSLFAITTTVTVGCVVTLCLLLKLVIRKRKTTKRLTNWRTGYGLQLKANISTIAIDASLTWNFKAPPSPVISVCMPLNCEAEKQSEGSPSTPQSESSTALDVMHIDCETENSSLYTAVQNCVASENSTSSSYIKQDVSVVPTSPVCELSPVLQNVSNSPPANSNTKMTSSAVQKDIFAVAPGHERETTNQFYIPSLIYTEGWPIETYEYEDALLYSLDSTFDLTTENKYQIPTSCSMPTLTDGGNYIQAVPYKSIEGINMEHETSRSTAMKVPNNNEEIHSDYCLDITHPATFSQRSTEENPVIFEFPNSEFKIASSI